MLQALSGAGLMGPFDDWCSHQQQIGRLRHAASVRVYRAMWTALADWCAQQQPGHLPLQALDVGLLRRYLDSRLGRAGPGQGLNVRYQLRLLRLVQWVQAHQLSRHDRLGAAGAAGGGALPRATAAALAWSAASLAARPAVAMTAADAPASLGAAGSDQLMVWLLDGQAAAATLRWQDLRDRCALALQLGAGIGPGDLRALCLADVLPPGADRGHTGWYLQVPANGNAAAYQAPVAAWAASVLQQWLAARSQARLPGGALFPATRSGKPWGKVAQYGSVRKALAAAGLPDGPGGSFRLRHSFALRQLVHGHSADTVAGWLGVSDPHVMQRYRQALGSALSDRAALSAHAAHGAPAAGSDQPPAWPV